MNTSHEIDRNLGGTKPHEKGFANVCIASCRKLLGQIQRTKDSILAEFSGRVAEHKQVLQLALTEAEALAWQTGVPQLVFPTLAAEKAQAVLAWHNHQNSLRFGNVEHAFAS